MQHDTDRNTIAAELAALLLRTVAPSSRLVRVKECRPDMEREIVFDAGPVWLYGICADHAVDLFIVRKSEPATYFVFESAAPKLGWSGGVVRGWEEGKRILLGLRAAVLAPFSDSTIEDLERKLAGAYEKRSTPLSDYIDACE